MGNFTLCRFRDGPKNGVEQAVADDAEVTEFQCLPQLTTADFTLKPVPVIIQTTRHRYRRSAITPHLFVYDGEADKAERDIPFTQFLLPDGRRQAVTVSVCHDVADIADTLLARDPGRYRLECEVLRTGQVSVTIADGYEEMDADIRVVENGPGVREAVENMLRNFDVEEWEKGQSE